jgi:hypothetical protein
MRHEAVEEDDIARLGLHRLKRQPVAFQRMPLLPDEPLLVPASGDFEAAILECGRIDRDHRGEEQRRVDAPSRLLILMGRETTAARQLEIDLVLEQHGLAAQQRARPGDQAALPQQGVEPGMERTEILDPLNEPAPGLDQAVLVVNHLAPRHFRRGGDFLGPLIQLATRGRLEEAAHHKEAGTLEFSQLGRCRLPAHAMSSGSTVLSARRKSSAKSISIQGSPVTSSKPRPFPPRASTMSRIGSSYSALVRASAR